MELESKSYFSRWQAENRDRFEKKKRFTLKSIYSRITFSRSYVKRKCGKIDF